MLNGGRKSIPTKVKLKIENINTEPIDQNKKVKSEIKPQNSKYYIDFEKSDHHLSEKYFQKNYSNRKISKFIILPNNGEFQSKSFRRRYKSQVLGTQEKISDKKKIGEKKQHVSFVEPESIKLESFCSNPLKTPDKATRISYCSFEKSKSNRNFRSLDRLLSRRKILNVNFETHDFNKILNNEDDDSQFEKISYKSSKTGENFRKKISKKNIKIQKTMGRLTGRNNIDLENKLPQEMEEEFKKKSKIRKVNKGKVLNESKTQNETFFAPKRKIRNKTGLKKKEKVSNNEFARSRSCSQGKNVLKRKKRRIFKKRKKSKISKLIRMKRELRMDVKGSAKQLKMNLSLMKVRVGEDEKGNKSKR